MAYVSGFKHDIFISYASVNNLDPEEGKMGWVTSFRDRLEKALACRIGMSFNMWMDKKDIAIGDDFEEEIIGAVTTSATLLIIMSECYLDSEWCRTEKDEFWKQVDQLKMSKTDGISGLNRIFIVRFEDVNRNKYPPELKRLNDADFFRVDEKKKVHTLGWPQLLTTDPNYYKYTDQLSNLSNDLGSCLKKLKAIKTNTKPNVNTDANRHFYEKMMKECHGLIVIYGESDENWVSLVLQNSVTIPRTDPLQIGAIIQGPAPLEDEREGWLPFQPNYMRRIDCIKEFNEEALRIFFSDLKNSFNQNTIDTTPNLGVIVFVSALGQDKALAKKICHMAHNDYEMTYYTSDK